MARRSRRWPAGAIGALFVFGLLSQFSVQPVRADGATVPATAAAKYVGQVKAVCGVVASAKYAQSTRGQPTFLNLDQPYPNQVFTAVIWGDSRGAFSYAPESLQGRRICVTGEIELYRGRAQVIVADPRQIDASRS